MHRGGPSSTQLCMSSLDPASLVGGVGRTVGLGTVLSEACRATQREQVLVRQMRRPQHRVSVTCLKPQVGEPRALYS